MQPAGRYLSHSCRLTRFYTRMAKQSVYDFTVKDADGKNVSLEKYRGKPLIIVNVASQCGFTDTSYKEMKELADKYRDKGLSIAAFPCNQFGNEEPGCAIDVKKSVAEKFDFEPDIYDKVYVNGPDAEPLFQFLKEKQGGFLVDAIKWNFTKFLVDLNGQPVKRYGPTTSVKNMVKDIDALLVGH